MRILYLSPRVPFPADQGNKVVIYNQIRALSGKNEITLLCLSKPNESTEGVDELKKYCRNVEVFRRRPNFSLANIIRTLSSRLPFTVVRYRSAELEDRVKALVKSGTFDVVHVAYYYMAQYAVRPDLEIPKRTALVIETHNIEHMLYHKYAELTPNPLRKLLLFLEAGRLKKYELDIYGRFDGCFAFSGSDRDAIERSCPQCRIQLPVIEREPAPDRYAHIREEKNTLLFFGHLRYFANEDAIKYFYKEIFHMVREKIPGVKLRIMGRGATPFMRRMAADPNVELIGYADDIIAELKKAALIIVPIRLGGGIRLKTLTAWKAGRAVISTSVGADGLPYKDGIDIAIADEPRDFSKKTIQLLNDDDLRKNIGEAGYANIQKNFNADKITSEIEGCYRGLIEGKGANEAR